MPFSKTSLSIARRQIRKSGAPCVSKASGVNSPSAKARKTFPVGNEAARASSARLMKTSKFRGDGVATSSTVGFRTARAAGGSSDASSSAACSSVKFMPTSSTSDLIAQGFVSNLLAGISWQQRKRGKRGLQGRGAQSATRALSGSSEYCFDGGGCAPQRPPVGPRCPWLRRSCPGVVLARFAARWTVDVRTIRVRGVHGSPSCG